MTALAGWSTAALAQLAGSVVRPGVVLRIATDPVVRIWAGDGDLTLDVDLIEDDASAPYLGFGQLARESLAAVSQLINGEADRKDFQLSGAAVTAQVAALASNEAAEIRGVAVNLGLLVFDGDWQKLSPVAWLWEGTADSLMVDRDDASGLALRTITLSVGSLFTGRRRPTPSYWTNADQRLRSADDRFCERVAGYNVGTTMVWPK